MRKAVAALLFTIVLGICFADRSPGEGIKIENWSFMAPIESRDRGLLGVDQFALSPEVLNAALPDLRDLRVVARGTEEIGYVLKSTRGSIHRIPLEVMIYNRTYIPGKQSSVTVDFGQKVLKNRVKVETGGTNFKRRVRIEGSDDGRNWQMVRDGAFLFRVQDSADKGVRFEENETEFPDNDFRYLKITVFNESGDKSVVDMKDVTAWRLVRIIPESVDVPIRNVNRAEKNRTTEIKLDLGYRNLRLYELKLAFSDDNFFRRVRVLGRNRQTRVVRTKAEDAPHRERTVKEKWKNIRSGTVFRFSTDGSHQESPAISLSGGNYRYLLVRILNRDDPPLRFLAATVTRRVNYVEFAPKVPDGYTVYVGNPEARRPSYDIGHYIGRLRDQGVSRVALGKLVPNPLHKAAERPVPWSERHRGIIWIALLAMVAVLGILIYRVIASTRTTES